MRGAYSSKRNFLFDLDGTLVDSGAAHARAYVQALTPAHPDLAKSFIYEDHAGRPTREVLATLGVPGATRDELTRRKQECYRAALDRGEVRLFPGVMELLNALAHRERGLFIVTGASRISAERILNGMAIAKFFTGLVAAEDVEIGKPSPECYLRVLSRFKLAAPECLVVEDGRSGVEAAQAAGLDVVLIHTQLHMAGVPRVRDAAELLRQVGE